MSDIERIDERTIACRFSEIDERFRGRDPWEVLEWASAEYGDRVALATGFGAEGSALVDMASRHAPSLAAFYLDTGLLFDETLETRDRLSLLYGVSFLGVRADISLDEQAAQFGEELWKRDPDLCCGIRKVAPLNRILGGLDAWVTAIRRDQSPDRAGIRIVEWDRNHGLVKINPLADWHTEDVWRYIHGNAVPYNPLHDRGYPSIGCHPCTTPVLPGEDARAGRWRGHVKTECGLHRKPRG